MGITLGGLVSGMDTDSIISQLQAVQKRPILQLQQKESDYNVKITSYGTLRSSLAKLQDAANNLNNVSDITSNSATSSNTDKLTVDAENSADAGTYSITVNKLAAAHKMTSDPLQGFNPTEYVGKGTIHLALGSNSGADIAIGETSTISDVAKAINAADVGVNAAVINDGTKSYLSLTGNQTGDGNTISLTVIEDGKTSGDPANLDTIGLSRLYSGNLKEIQAASNSSITMNGIQNISRATNSIDDVISGVTFTLKSADQNNPLTVSIERSNDLLTSRMTDFLDAYNGLVDTLKTLQSYNSETKKAGNLLGDSTTRQIQNKVQSLISSSVSGLSVGMNRLSDLGVSTDDNGKLVLNTTTFNAKLKDNFDNVSKFFTLNSTGFAVRLSGSLQKMLSTADGALAVRTKGIQKSIDTIEDQISSMNDRLNDSETRLRKQFSSLETLLGKYQNISDSLTASLKQIQSSSSSNS